MQAQILIMRFNSSGVLDTSFNGNGIVLLPLGARAMGGSLTIQPTDGKIVVGGFYVDGLTGNTQSIITRYATNGTPDTAFATNGIANCPISLASVEIDSNANILVCGSSTTGAALVRFTSAGVLDNSFGSGGVAALIEGNAGANGFAFDASNNIVVTGFSSSELFVARCTSAGVLDTTFNGTGYNTLFFANINVGNSVNLQSNGNIIVVGYTDHDFLIVSYLTGGTVDPSWGNNGIVAQPSGTQTILVTQLWEQEAPGTDGGTFTAGTWQTRILNQLSTSDSAITLSNNQFTLAEGNYSVHVSAPAYLVGNHQIQLQNLTDGVTALIGSTAFSNPSNGSMTSSVINAQLTVSKLTTFAVQHFCAQTEVNDGFGIAAGFGSAEIYTSVTITPN